MIPLVKTDRLSVIPAGERWIRASMATGILLLLVLVFFIDPTKTALSHCAFSQMTGLSCPTCGMTRSLHEALHLHWMESIHFHWMGLLSLMILILSAILFAVEGTSGRRIHLPMHSRQGRVLLLAFFIGWALFWIGRMIVESTGQDTFFQVP